MNQLQILAATSIGSHASKPEITLRSGKGEHLKCGAQLLNAVGWLDDFRETLNNLH